MNEPTISLEAALRLISEYQSEGMCIIRDDTMSKFLGKNKGITDDGEHIDMAIFGRIIEEE